MARINIFSVGSGLANVGGLTFETATRSSQLIVFLGQGTPSADGEIPLPLVANNWGGLSVNTATQQWIRLSAGIAGDLTGPVFADTINRLQIGGVQDGAIDATATLGDAVDIKYVKAFRGGGDAAITTSGAIGTIEMTNEYPNVSLQSDVIAGEFIQRIDCGGSIGIPTTFAIRIEAVTGINALIASSINANIKANANNGTGGIYQVLAERKGLEGTLTADFAGDETTLNSYVIAAANAGDPYDMDVTIDGDFNGAFGMNGGPPAVTRPNIHVGGDWNIGAVKWFGGPIGSMHIQGDLNVLPDGFFELFDILHFEVDGNVSGSLAIASSNAIRFGSFSRGVFAGEILGGFEYPFWPPYTAPEIVIEGSLGEEGPVFFHVGPDTQMRVLGAIGPNVDIWSSNWAGSLQCGSNGPATISFFPLFTLASQFDAQIVVNAGGNPPLPNNASYWPGSAFFVDDSGDVIELQEDYTYPHYATGIEIGAVGVVPFRVHDETSFPKNLVEYPSSTEAVLTSVFNSSCTTGTGVQLEFYGPVATTGSANQPKAEVVLLDGNGGDLLDVSRFVSVTRDTLRPRQLNIRAKNGAQVPLPSGIYEVRPLSENRIVCADLLPGAPVTPVAEFSYRFRLTPDCIGGGPNGDQPDCIADSANCGDTSICDSIDFNNNGVFPEEDDVTDFFNVLSGGACSTGDCNDIDFNNNFVFPEEQDVILFFHVLAGGEC